MHKTVEELSVKVHNMLNHVCVCHDNCNIAECYDKKAVQGNLPLKPSSDHWLD